MSMNKIKPKSLGKSKEVSLTYGAPVFAPDYSPASNIRLGCICDSINAANKSFMSLALANVNIKSFFFLNDVTERALGHSVNLTLRLLAILSTDTKSLSGMGKELSRMETSVNKMITGPSFQL